MKQLNAFLDGLALRESARNYSACVLLDAFSDDGKQQT